MEEPSPISLSPSLFWYLTQLYKSIQLSSPLFTNGLAPIHLFLLSNLLSSLNISDLAMEKAASSRTLYHCLSLAEVVGFLILDSILVWVARLQKFSARFLPYSSRTRTGEWKKTTSDAAKEDHVLRKEDVDIIMESMRMPGICGSDKLKDCMGFDELCTIFEEKEPSLEEAKEAFSVFDENCDGFIDAMELQGVLCKLGFREGADLDACQQMIETHDENKDGKIDFNEFVRFMESSFC